MLSRILRLVAIVIWGNFVTGCASFNDDFKEPADEVLPLTNEQRQEILEMLKKNKDNEILLAQWQQSKAGVARLLAIESDLKVLIEQLSQFSYEEAGQTNSGITDQAEPSVAKLINTMEPSGTISGNVKNPAVGVNLNMNELFAIQLTAMRQEEELLSVWKRLLNEQPLILRDLSPMIEKVELTNGPIYRLKAGRFNSVKQATVVCNKLRVKNIPCIVSQYSESLILVP